MEQNSRSDRAAKEEFVKELEKEGYEKVEIISTPVDIIAEKDGVKWYFEIKKTSKTKKIFGAATLTEWNQAYADSEHFRFVIAVSKDNIKFNFYPVTIDEFALLSSIPPFKINFNIPDIDKLSQISKLVQTRTGSRTVKVNENRVKKLNEFYMKLKKNR